MQNKLINIDPKVDLCSFFRWVFSNHPKKPFPKPKFDFRTGESLTYKNFYVHEKYLK